MKWLAKFLLLNIVMLAVFALSDYATWTDVYRGLKPMEWVCAQHGGTLYNVTIGARYELIARFLWIRALYDTGSGGFAYPRAGFSHTTNAPLLVFVLTVGLNLLLVAKMEEALGAPKPERTQGLTTEPSGEDE